MKAKEIIKKKEKRKIKRDNDNVNNNDKRGLESPMTMKRHSGLAEKPRNWGSHKPGKMSKEGQPTLKLCTPFALTQV